MTTSRKRVRLPPSRPRTRTEQQSEDDRRRYAAQQRQAAVAVCDRVIAEGCAGPGCRKGHGRHVAGVIQVLRLLGIIPDPEARWELGPGYTTSKSRKRTPA